MKKILLSIALSFTALGFAALGFIALGAFISQAHAAASVSSFELNDQDRVDVGRIEAYLNSIGTLQSRFIQMTSTGQVSQGDFYISRPGKMRIDYDEPVPVLIVSDGLFLIYQDTDLEQTTHLPLSSTPAGVLVDKDVQLMSEDLVITDIQRNANAIRVSLMQVDDPYAGFLTLSFSDKPLSLRQWTVLDAQGTITDFSLVNPRFGLTLDPSLFVVKTKRINNNPDK